MITTQQQRQQQQEKEQEQLLHVATELFAEIFGGHSIEQQDPYGSTFDAPLAASRAVSFAKELIKAAAPPEEDF